MAGQRTDDAPKLVLDGAEGDDESYVVVGDDRRLGQVFYNLIDNAMSFCRKDGQVRIKLRRLGGSIEAAVEDDGPGIRPGQSERIFERFYTDRPDKEEFGQNSGLGLSITKQIVEAHRRPRLGGEPGRAGQARGRAGGAGRALRGASPSRLMERPRPAPATS